MKQRLDVLMVERGLAPSREKAKALIMTGVVYVNGQKEDKAGSSFDSQKADIEVRGKALPFVSRGGLKLDKAIKEFSLDVKGLVCLDIGASTGGFTDCMLQSGAARIYAVDVGYGQLDYGLRQDGRVICMEKTNFRYVTREQIPEPIGFAATDVSFISLTRILPAAFPLLADNAFMVALIKPQFEAGREHVGKKGVVRDPAIHLQVVRKIYDFAVETGFCVIGLSYSPIKGPEGNIEYLLLLQKSGGESISVSVADEVVFAAHGELD